MIEKSQHSTPNQDKRYEEWMFDSGIPKVWSNYLDINDDDQLHGKGFPILRPIKRIADEENPQGEGEFRFPNYWEIETQHIEQLIEKQGTDALAWYRPFHMDKQEKWGITILDQGIWYVARKLAKEMYSEPYTVNQIQFCRNLALDFLYHHEMFHFKVELAATMMELIRPSEPIYARYWNHQEHQEWFGSEVKSHPNGWVKAPLEEALANSYAWDKVYSEYGGSERKIVKGAIKQFMKGQPDGYKHAWRLSVGGENWKSAMNELINKLLDADDGNHFSPQKILASHLLFDGVQGKEDWIDEYYAGIVPCRILNTDFAGGRFSESTEGMDFGIWCVSSKFYGKFKNYEGNVQETFERICQEYSNLTLGKGIKDPRAYENFRKNSQFAGRAKKFDRGKKTRQNIYYFRFVAQNFRAYHEMNRSGEEVLILTHRKRGDETPKKHKKYLHGSNRSGIMQHEKECKNKS